MARRSSKNKQRRIHSDSHGRPKEPFISLRVLSWATGIFVAIVLLLMAISMSKQGSYQQNKEMAEGTIFTSPEQIPRNLVHSFDALLVLGGGKPTSLYDPPVYVQKRCDDAVTVVQRRRKESHLTYNRPLPILCLSAGTAHMPQLLSNDGQPIWESTSSAAYIIQKYGSNGDNANADNTIIIDPNQLYVETTSYDTIGNAYYARVQHTDITNWNRLLIITNEFHMERSKAIFDWIYSLKSLSKKNNYHLYYLSSPNIGLSKDALDARIERESNSLKSVQKMSQTMKSLYSIWQFLNHKHDLYTASKLVQRDGDNDNSAGSPTDPKARNDLLKKSYGGN